MNLPSTPSSPLAIVLWVMGGGRGAGRRGTGAEGGIRIRILKGEGGRVASSFQIIYENYGYFVSF